MSVWAIDLHGQSGSFCLDIRFASDSNLTVLVGHNGAGKTTLLKYLLGVREPQSGNICLQGRTLFDGAKGVNLAPEQRRLGYVPQGYALFPTMTAQANVAFGLAGRMGAREAKERAMEQLSSLGVGHLARRFPDQLSGGEAQRVSLARALAIEPAGLLLDEPLAALDTTRRAAMRRFLVNHLADLNCATLIVTHSRRDVLAFGEHVVVLEDGKVAQSGSRLELEQSPATPFVRDLLSDGVAGPSENAPKPLQLTDE